MSKFCITFAGPVGSSKTPIAYYLSHKLGLSIINNDAMRTEIAEDLLKFDQEAYLKIRDERGRSLIQSGRPFIYDASVDREWPRLYDWLSTAGYTWFIISLDFSQDLLEKIYSAKHYTETHRLPLLLAQHKEFLQKYEQEVGLHLTDADFLERLEKSLRAARAFISRQT